MSGWARAGAKCAFVGHITAAEAEWASMHSIALPRLNETYTLRQVFSDRQQRLHCRLVEIVNPSAHPDLGETREASFPLKWFRPLIGQSEDVALFTHHFDRVGELA